MNRDALSLFALNASRELGAGIADKLGRPLAAHEEREFEDGEHKSRPLENVRGRDVFVIQSLYADASQSVDDKLMRLLLFLGALRDAAAERVTAVVPYLAYARKDAKTQTRDPVTTRYIAALFEATGVDRVVTMDVHNLAAYQNAFRCRTEHLEAVPLFIDYFRPLLERQEKVVVVSPDIGGVKRAERLRRALTRVLRREAGLAFLEKARARGIVNFGRLTGDVIGAAVVIVDDMIGTGSTLAHAAESCRERGATEVYAAATHGLFVGDAGRVLATDALTKLVVTDTVPPFRLVGAPAQEKLEVLPVAGLFAEAVARLHGGGSLVELLGL